MPTSTELRSQAETIKNDFNDGLTDIRSQGLRPEVELGLIADLYLRYAPQLRDLRSNYKVNETRELHSQRREAFGADDLRLPGGDAATHAVSYRDAQDRAEAARSSADLLKLMQRAEDSGDQLLARACAARATQMRWVDVVEVYDDLHPGYAEKAFEARNATSTVALATGIIFTLRTPKELAGGGADGRITPSERDLRAMVEAGREARRQAGKQAQRRVGV